MKYLKIHLALAAIFLGSLVCKADVSVADVFSDNMVLQRNIDLSVWGTADAGERLSVSFNGQKVKTKANKNGKWSIILKPMKAGGPLNMVIRGKNEIILENILIGDVWVCSGQSNMEWKVSQSSNADKEIQNANYPNIRLFTVPKKISTVPLEERWM